MKKNFNVEILTDGLPEEIKLFMDYIKKLKFDEDPNYDYLKKLLKTVINSKDSSKNYYFN